MEDKISQIISECFSKLHEAFEESGKELDYDFDTYVEEMILNEFNK